MRAVVPLARVSLERQSSASQPASEGRQNPVRIARFSIDGNVAFGAVEGDGTVASGDLVLDIIKGIPYADFELSGTKVPLSKVRLLPPVLPNKVVAIGRNYAEHAAELGHEVPDVPVAFFKPTTSVIGSGDAIEYPSFSDEVHYEAELAVVIGRMCREVPRERVKDVVFGYTCANDVTARDAQKREKQWARAKGFDTSCPLGPWVETDLDPSDLAIQATVNGEQRQLGRTSDMIRSIEDLVVHITEAMTLLPGDVILTGTPAGVGPLHVGDEVAVTIEGIGTLTNKVIKRG
jgi:2-keto-4-pentenoate hydratase/2-oxohepta-3-ene-1,7-dioic acid hydratase in catechol pathway